MRQDIRRRRWLVWLLTGLLLLLSVNAIVAGAAFIVAPDGHLLQMPLSQLSGSPFSNFRVPGILLLVFIGLFALLAASGLSIASHWRWPEALNPLPQFHWSWTASWAVGVALIVWIVVQVQWIAFNPLHSICLVWGASIIAITLAPSVRQYGKQR